MEQQKFNEETISPAASSTSPEASGSYHPKWYRHINFFIAMLIVTMLVLIVIQARLR